MAYDINKVIKDCIKAIEKHKVVFFEELVAYIPVSKGYLYKNKLHENEDIKSLMGKNRTNVKAYLREQWRESKSPIERIALYKLLSTKDEHQKISGYQVDHTTDGKEIKQIQLVYNDNRETPKELNESKKIETPEPLKPGKKVKLSHE